MELFEQIRRGYPSGETIKGLAKKHGVHRRMVRQANRGNSGVHRLPALACAGGSYSSPLISVIHGTIGRCLRTFQARVTTISLS